MSAQLTRYDIVDRLPGGPSPDASPEQVQIWLEVEETIFGLEMEALGCAHRLAGLVWFPPLCHDGRDY